MADKQKTILIVEDSLTQALSLRLLLENHELRVLHAPNGSQGLTMARQYLPDAVVLDIEMPGMNGFEVSIQLSRDPRTAHIPIIMFTSHDNTTAFQKGMLMGAMDFIPKDIFADAVLLETLRQLNILERKNGGT